MTKHLLSYTLVFFFYHFIDKKPFLLFIEEKIQEIPEKAKGEILKKKITI